MEELSFLEKWLAETGLTEAEQKTNVNQIVVDYMKTNKVKSVPNYMEILEKEMDYMKEILKTNFWCDFIKEMFCLNPECDVLKLLLKKIHEDQGEEVYEPSIVCQDLELLFSTVIRIIDKYSNENGEPKLLVNLALYSLSSYMFIQCIIRIVMKLENFDLFILEQLFYNIQEKAFDKFGSAVYSFDMLFIHKSLNSQTLELYEVITNIVDKNTIKKSDAKILIKLFETNSEMSSVTFGSPYFIKYFSSAVFKSFDLFDEGDLVYFAECFYQIVVSSDVPLNYEQSKSFHEEASTNIYKSMVTLKKLKDSKLNIADYDSTFQTLHKSFSFSAFSYGYMNWFLSALLSKNYSDATVCTTMTFYFILFDIIIEYHCENLSAEILDCLKSILYSSFDHVESLTEIKIKKKVMKAFLYLMMHQDKMFDVHLVIQNFMNNSPDTSLILFFLRKMFKAVQSPYSDEFKVLWTPLLKHDKIQSGFRNKEKGLLNSFIKELA